VRNLPGSPTEQDKQQRGDNSVQNHFTIIFKLTLNAVPQQLLCPQEILLTLSTPNIHVLTFLTFKHFPVHKQVCVHQLGANIF